MQTSHCSVSGPVERAASYHCVIRRRMCMHAGVHAGVHCHAARRVSAIP
jgi:hypothetical protein